MTPQHHPETSQPCIRPLICPVCSQPLALVAKALQCPHAHAFDLARQGYVNLLPAHKKPALGDTPAMLQARRRFLEAGYYAPLSEMLNELALAHLGRRPPAATITAADVGCGEGYYVGHLQQQLVSTRSGAACCFGLDVAKAAAKMAARRYPAVRFVVADVWQQIPFDTHSLDLLLNVFAPRNSAEFGRVLAPGGLLLIAIPAPEHLLNLRHDLALLAQEPEKEQRVMSQLAGAFTLAAKWSLHYDLKLTPAALLDLLQMTPNARHLDPEQAAAAHTLDPYRTTAAFTLLAFLNS